MRTLMLSEGSKRHASAGGPRRLGRRGISADPHRPRSRPQLLSRPERLLCNWMKLRILGWLVAGVTLAGCADEFASRGSFPTQEEQEGPSCTVHRPSELSSDEPHPVILWGNGTATTPSTYAEVLEHWASHGFIVAAADTSNAGSGEEMVACLDYLITESETEGSVYEGAVDTSRVGASGHSQGGGGSIMAGADPRVGATAPLQPYTVGLGHDVSSQSQQSGPMLLLSGSLDTWAPPGGNQQPVFDNTNVPVFWATATGADHIESATGDISVYRGPSTAWFRLHLMDDESARSRFYGPDCGLCTDLGWEIQRKDL